MDNVPCFLVVIQKSVSTTSWFLMTLPILSRFSGGTATNDTCSTLALTSRSATKRYPSPEQYSLSNCLGILLQEAFDEKSCFVLLHLTWEALGRGAELLNLRKRIKVPTVRWLCLHIITSSATYLCACVVVSKL